ncbi:MAG: Crp/Fnr family transcriptional regulator [Leadbetterella sp.]
MKANNLLSQYLSQNFPFSGDSMDALSNNFVIKTFKKGDLILRNGSIETELRILNKGIVREYYATDDVEKNVNFYINSGVITDCSSFNLSTTTNKYQECLVDTELSVLSKDVFFEFTSQFEHGELLIKTIFQRIVLKKDADEYNTIVNSPESMYLDLMKSKPDWLQHIPQYHIASFLGITPETLSRIRKRI